MRVAWWNPRQTFIDSVSKLLNMNILPYVHYDQNMLLRDPDINEYSLWAINADIIVFDSGLFPIIDGYIGYSTTLDMYYINLDNAMNDFLNAIRFKKAILLSVGGRFATYLATRKGVIPPDIDTIIVYTSTVTAIVPKVSTLNGAEWSQDIWYIADLGIRELAFQMSRIDPGTTLHADISGVIFKSPFTDTEYEMMYPLKVYGYDVSCITYGFVPLTLYSYTEDTTEYTVAPIAIAHNTPIVIYSIKWASDDDTISIINDLVTGLLRAYNRPVIEACDRTNVICQETQNSMLGLFFAMR